MALMKCKECKKEVSDKAITCPHCGAPVELPAAPAQPVPGATQDKPTKKKMSIWQIVIWAFVGAIVFSFFANKKEGASAPGTAATTPAADRSMPTEITGRSVLGCLTKDLFNQANNARRNGDRNAFEYLLQNGCAWVDAGIKITVLDPGFMLTHYRAYLPDGSGAVELYSIKEEVFRTPANTAGKPVAALVPPALKTFSSPVEVLKFFRHYDEADGNIKVVSNDPYKVEVWEGDFWNEVGTPKNDLFLKRMLINNLYLLFYHTPLDHITLTVYARSADNANLDKPSYSISISRQKALDVAKDIFQVTDYADLFKIYEYDTDVNVMDLDSHRYIETVNDTDKLNQLIKALGVSVMN